MKKMNSFKRSLIMGYSVSLLLLIISSVASYMSIRSLLNSFENVNHTHIILQRLESVISSLKDAETGQRGFLLTGKDDFLEPYNGATGEAVSLLDEIKRLTADNEPQQETLVDLQHVVMLRLSILQSLIDRKRLGDPPSLESLYKGKQYMDDARRLVHIMQAREDSLLKQRTDNQNRFAGFTPVIIVVASLLSLIITVLSFMRVTSDYEKRMQLQLELEEKDRETTRRIDVMQNLAKKISSGDYTIRVADQGEDGLGNLSYSLNAMAMSLDKSFTLLSEKEWLQAGVAGLNERMLGEHDVEALGQNILDFIVDWTKAEVGAFYLMHDDGQLHFVSGYAFAPSEKSRILKAGEGLLGQVVHDKKLLQLRNVEPDFVTITYTGGEIRPAHILAVPLIFEGVVKGAIELASVHEFPSRKMLFLEAVSGQVGIVINTSENRRRLQQLLEETQSQGEELRAQHSELENINSELEAQSEKLQVSEEELKVQQEELMEANRELEERSRLLEERNQVIAERNENIQQKAEELELSTRYKSEFLANMSHELRTPLNSILLLSRLMSENGEKNLTEDQVEFARVIQSSGQGLLSLIDEILDLSKIESGKMELDYSMVQVQQIIENIDSLFGALAREKNLELKFHVAADVPAHIETDLLRLEQIIRNLVSNALKFTAEGSVTLSIERFDEGRLAFKVSDTGIGIPAAKQGLIFEAFQQADGSTRRKYGGTGLGLSISRELVKLLGGEISVASTAGQGSSFMVIIPESKQAATIAKTVKEPMMPELPEPVEQRPKNLSTYVTEVIPESIPDDRDSIGDKDRTILIVEDDTAFAKSLLEFTRSKGYKGVVSVRGDEALALAETYKPIGVLLDIQLPVKDGWQVMEELKSNPLTRHIPVHIMSSLEFRRQSLVQGAVDFINKPLAFEKMQQVFQKIESVLSRHPKKVLIVEENAKHAQALALYLDSYNVNSVIRDNIHESVSALKGNEVDCVILDMGIPGAHAYDTLEEVKKTPGMENLPIIIFTGKSLSQAEEGKIKQYADSIIIKTAHSYQRILDEVSLFLHVVDERLQPAASEPMRKLGAINEVLKNKQVLVADDDVRNIFSLTRALENFGVSVISAIDGKEAMKQLQSHPNIDLVLMDMMMPEMDGYETTAAIRKLSRYRTLPIIAVTAKAMTGDREKCIQAGASDYITKPVDIDQLLSLLRVWLYEKQ